MTAHPPLSHPPTALGIDPGAFPPQGGKILFARLVTVHPPLSRPPTRFGRDPGPSLLLGVLLSFTPAPVLVSDTVTRLLLSFVSRPRGWLRHACGMRRHQREHCGMPAGDACGMPAACLRPAGMPAGMPAGSAGMLQQACALLAQASKMERMLECLLNRRHCKGSKSFYYGRHSSILSILLAWVSKTHACWRMPAQPAGMPAGMPRACRRHPARLVEPSRRQPAAGQCLPIPQAGGVPAPSLGGWAVKGSLRALKALELKALQRLNSALERRIQNFNKISLPFY